MRIKLFEDFDEKPTISFQEACDWIVENYDEMKVCETFDDELLNWVDYDQMHEDELESEYDWYVNYGNGEAEDVVRQDIIRDLQGQFNLDFEPYSDETDLNQFLMDTYDVLNKI